MSPDETAQAIRRTITDAERRIAFDPQSRPGVSALLSTAALCMGEAPEETAERIGNSGSGALKQLTTDAVNDFLSGHRERRAELARDPGYVSQVLKRGNERANLEANQTLEEVRMAMGTNY